MMIAEVVADTYKSVARLDRPSPVALEIPGSTGMNRPSHEITVASLKERRSALRQLAGANQAVLGRFAPYFERCC